MKKILERLLTPSDILFQFSIQTLVSKNINRSRTSSIETLWLHLLWYHIDSIWFCWFKKTVHATSKIVRPSSTWLKVFLYLRRISHSPFFKAAYETTLVPFQFFFFKCHKDGVSLCIRSIIQDCVSPFLLLYLS